MLHVTNGDSVLESLAAAGIAGDKLPWRDVLHAGPVPGDCGVHELAALRAQFLAELSGRAAPQIRLGMQSRDDRLAALTADDQVLLWFEHDLYDQLQLLQILDRFSDRGNSLPQLQLICIDRHPEIPRFCGLGQLTPAQLAPLQGLAAPVTSAQLELAARAWAAFRSPDPTALVTVIKDDGLALPFLAAALLRHLEEFPSTRNGLSRTEEQILLALQQQPRTATQLFVAVDEAEAAPFMGDETFFWYLDRMATAAAAPAVRQGDLWSLTADGERLLAAQADFCSGGLDRWLGGVHLRGVPAWRWDRAARQLVLSPR